MKLVKLITVVCAFSAVSAYAVDPVRSEITCEQLAEQYEATAEAKERFAELEGTCEGVYEINGHLYARSQAVVRSRVARTVRLFLPATGNTFEVVAQPDGRVWVGDTKIRTIDLNRGDEIGIYLSVDKFAEKRVDEISFATEDTHEEEVISISVEEVPALPTTG